jgi:hypothetical protein
MLIENPAGAYINYANGIKVARAITKREDVQDLALANRTNPGPSRAIQYSTALNWDKGENATGVWVLTGNAANQKRSIEVANAFPTASRSEVLRRAGAIYYDHCKHSHIIYPS